MRICDFENKQLLGCLNWLNATIDNEVMPERLNTYIILSNTIPLLSFVWGNVQFICVYFEDSGQKDK